MFGSKTKQRLRELFEEVERLKDELESKVAERTAELRAINAELEREIEGRLHAEHSYQALAENLPAIVYRVFLRENNRMQFFNDMLFPMTGYTMGELQKGEICSIEPFILKEDLFSVVRAVKHAVLQRQPFSVEYRFAHKSGEPRHFLERGRPICGADGRPLHIDGVIFDITERKTSEEMLKRNHENLEGLVRARTEEIVREVAGRRDAQELLRESIDKLSAITSSALDAIVLVDSHGSIAYLNPAGERLFGRKAGEVMGKKMHDHFIPARLHDAYKEAFKSFKTTGQPGGGSKIFETLGLRKDGTEFPVEVSVSAVKIKDKWHTVGVMRDITERKQAEMEMMESEHRYRSLIESASDTVYTLSPDGKITSLNPAFETTTGWPREEWLGRHFSEILHPDDLAPAVEMFLSVLHGETPPRFNLRVKSKSGSYLTGEFSHTGHIKEGILIGILGFVRDITPKTPEGEASS